MDLQRFITLFENKVTFAVREEGLEGQTFGYVRGGCRVPPNIQNRTVKAVYEPSIAGDTKTLVIESIA